MYLVKIIREINEIKCLTSSIVFMLLDITKHHESICKYTLF